METDLAWRRRRRRALLAAVLAATLSGAGVAAAADLVLTATDPAEPGSGGMGAAARAAALGGPLPAGPADRAAKAAADAAHAAGGGSPAGEAAPGPAAAGRRPSIVGGRSFPGLADPTVSPSDSTGAIGPTRFVQLVNRRFGIYARDRDRPLATGALTELAGVAPTVRAFDPQVIWDAATERFYYVMDGIYSATDNRLLVGFSKTASPSRAADWCTYQIRYGFEFPDFPKLGDSRDLAIVGVNVFSEDGFFLRSDLVAFRKPPAGAACPSPASLGVARRERLATPDGERVFTPVPANQIDAAADGYVVARNGPLPSDRLWVFRVGPGAGGRPAIDGVGRALALPFAYAIPPNATQPGLAQLLDTSDTRPTQAVLARNPRRGGAFSLWMQ